MDTQIHIENASKLIHVGCGTTLMNDFVNVDLDFSWYNNTIEEKILYKMQEKTGWILRHDVREGIPSSANSLELIYHCHFLEHLTRDEGFSFLINCYHSLMKGGYMRISLPDLEIWCNRFIQKDDAYFKIFREITGDPKDPYSQTNAATFNLTLYSFGHKCMYDFISLSEMLKMIGFKNIQKLEWGRSNKLNYMHIVEPADSPKAIESMVIECEK